MKLQEMVRVIEAFIDRKHIEVKTIGDDYWLDCFTPIWDFYRYEYRIKPQPEYVPFTWEDRDLFRDKWIRLKNAENEHKINFIGSSDNVSCSNWKEPMTLIDLFKSHEFIDGTPFGKLKQ